MTHIDEILEGSSHICEALTLHGLIETDVDVRKPKVHMMHDIFNEIAHDTAVHSSDA